MRSSTPLHLIASAFALLAAVQPAEMAWAQAPAAPAARDAVAAEALFREGRKAGEAGDFTAACPKFRESYRLDPTVGTLLNLANCKEKLGLLADAWEHYLQAREKLPAGDARIDVAERRASALEGRLPRLTIVLQAPLPPGGAVLRDGVALGSAALGIAIPVNPGERTVIVRAPGRRDESFRIALEEGSAKTLTVHAGPANTGSTTPAPSPAGTRRTIGFVLGGVGIAGLGVGAVTGVLTLGKASVIKDPAHCDPALRCDQAGVDAASAGKTLSIVSTVAFVTGIACVGTGIVLVLTDRAKPGAGSDAPATTSMVLNGRPAGFGIDFSRSF